MYYRINRLDEAEQQLTRSLQMSDKDPTIHDHLGDVYFKEGKLKEAIAQWGIFAEGVQCEFAFGSRAG